MNNEKILYTPTNKLNNAIPVWFCFPCNYSIGMSALGYLELFRIFDQNEKIAPERIFTDSTQTRHKIQDVKYFGFSYSFELDFLNIFKVLEKYNIPLFAKDRDDSHPIIYGGGPVLSANPEPFAEIFDFISLGDGEEIFEELAEKFYTIKNTECKKEKLKKLSKLKGIYVPSFYKIKYNPDYSIENRVNLEKATEIIEKRSIKTLSSCVCSPYVTENTMFSNTYLIEVARGCPQRCHFCLASYANLPTRFPSKASIISAINKGLEHTNKIGLLGALIAAHPDFNEICSYIYELRQEKEFEVSISSLRADEITPKVIKMLVACGQKSSTIAIEAGSDRLREFINKNLKEEQIFESVKVARENGLSGLKIYGMIGLPTETDEDILELIELMKNLKKENPKFNLTLSISSFVPKAQTPFQWYGREDNKSLEKKNNLLKKELHKLGIKFRPTSIKWDNIQGILSKGDRRLAPVIEKVYKFGGSLGSWGRAYKELKYESSNWQTTPDYNWFSKRQTPEQENLPWDFIESFSSKQKLYSKGNYISSGK